MNVVNTRTNSFHIHGCHTRTNHKSYELLLMYFTSWRGKKPKVSKKIHARLHEDITSSVGGNVKSPKFVFSPSFSFIIPHIYPQYVYPFTIYHTISMLNIWVSLIILQFIYFHAFYENLWLIIYMYLCEPCNV